MISRLFALSVIAIALAAQELPVVETVEFQPLGAQVARLLEALDMLGEPLPAADTQELKRLLAKPPKDAAAKVQQILDKHCLAGININPESRVKVQQGAKTGELKIGGQTREIFDDVAIGYDSKGREIVRVAVNEPVIERQGALAFAMNTI